MPGKLHVEIGTRYGNLVITGDAPYILGTPRKVCCRCDCGGTSTPQLNALRNGHTVSCGCVGHAIRLTANTTHGMHTSPEYCIYRSMIRRCHQATDPAYKYYGARGIEVCARWRESFANFIADMGLKPGPQMTLDRQDSNGGYNQANCRWATKTEQQRNRRDNRLIEFRGKQRTTAEISELTGINVNSLRYRVRSGATGELLALRPDRNGNRNSFGGV